MRTMNLASPRRDGKIINFSQNEPCEQSIKEYSTDLGWPSNIYGKKRKNHRKPRGILNSARFDG